jgi:outer membrane protein
MASSAKSEERALHEEVAYEIKSHLLNISVARKRISVAQYGLDQAKEAYRVAMARYEAQVGTHTELLDAQAKLSMAEAAFTQAQADYLITLSVLYVAMGIPNPTLDVALAPQ